MAAVISTGLDYSARRLSGAAIKAAGYRFVNRYLWFPGQRWPSLTADEYADLTAHGIEVHAIYEQNTNDPAGGWDAGVRMARQAVASAKAATLPAGRTIYMCADAWLTTHGIPVATAMRFLDGARSVLGPAGYLTGAYGFRDFIYAAQDGGHADRFWLCGAESGVRDGIHQYQWNNGTVVVDGVVCDLNKQYLPMIGEGMSAEGEAAILAAVQDIRQAIAQNFKATGEGIGTTTAVIRDGMRDVRDALAANYRANKEPIGQTTADIEAKVDKLTAAVDALTKRVDGISTGTGHSLEAIAQATAAATVAEFKKAGN